MVTDVKHGLQSWWGKVYYGREVNDDAHRFTCSPEDVLKLCLSNQTLKVKEKLEDALNKGTIQKLYEGNFLKC